MEHKLILTAALLAAFLSPAAHAGGTDIGRIKENVAETWGALASVVELQRKCGSVNPDALSRAVELRDEAERKIGKAKIEALREKMLRPGAENLMIRVRGGSCKDEDLKWVASWVNESYKTQPEQWNSERFFELFGKD